MNKPLKLFKTHWFQSDIEGITKVIKRGTFWADGQEIRDFENALQEYIGIKHAVLFNSGTSALHAILLAHNVKNKEVICPSFSFISSANQIIIAGGKPVFAESESQTFGLDASDVEKRITKKTKAIMLIHYGGCISRDTLKLRKIAKENNLVLIEDSAESLGAKLDSKNAGTFGNTAMFSFCQNKIITTGEGGVAVTNEKDIYEKLKLFRSHGRFELTDGDYFSNSKDSDYIELGYNYRMPTMLAALGLSQLKNIDEVLKLRLKCAEYLIKELKEIKDIQLPLPPKNHNHIYQMFTILLGDPNQKQKLQEHLTNSGIPTKTYFNPIHLKTYYKEKLKYSEGSLPYTEKLSQLVLTLPFYPDLTEQELKYIAEEIKKFFKK